jgi:DNA polymerase family B
VLYRLDTLPSVASMIRPVRHIFHQAVCAFVLHLQGLDMVRRDWCPLSKAVSRYTLDQIFSGKPRDDIVEAIHAHLSEVCLDYVLLQFFGYSSTMEPTVNISRCDGLHTELSSLGGGVDACWKCASV